MTDDERPQPIVLDNPIRRRSYGTPWLKTLVAVVWMGVVVLFCILLVVGPKGGWCACRGVPATGRHSC